MTDDNLPATVHKTLLEMPIVEMEGQLVRLFLGKIPALNLEMEMGYAYNTHLKVELDLRVRKYGLDEVRGGPNRGEPVREHIFDIEGARIIGVYTQEQVDEADGAGVGGSLAAGAETDDDDSDGDSDDRPNSEGAEDEQGLEGLDPEDCGPRGEVPAGTGTGFPDF